MALPFRHCSTNRLDQIVHQGLLCAFDFDGTLASPAAQAEKVRVPLGTVLRLFELSTYAPVAVVTPRSPTEIRSGLEFTPDFVVGGRDAATMPCIAEQDAVLSQLMRASGVKTLIYVGNDVSDEALSRLHGPELLSVRVGHARYGAGEFFLPHRLDMFQLLDELIRRLREAHARNWMPRCVGGAQVES